jgi:hypothetical protein
MVVSAWGGTSPELLLLAGLDDDAVPDELVELESRRNILVSRFQDLE